MVGKEKWLRRKGIFGGVLGILKINCIFVILLCNMGNMVKLLFLGMLLTFSFDFDLCLVRWSLT